MQHVQEAGDREADEAAGEAAPQARIIAYSDSDSDDPGMPSLPFRRRKADGGSDSENNADSSSSQPERKGLFAWRGWNRQENASQVHSICDFVTTQVLPRRIADDLGLPMQEAS